MTVTTPTPRAATAATCVALRPRALLRPVKQSSAWLISPPCLPQRAHHVSASSSVDNIHDSSIEYGDLVIGSTTDVSLTKDRASSRASRKKHLESLRNNSLIKQCTSWSELHALLEDRSETFNEFNVVAALGRMAALRSSADLQTAGSFTDPRQEQQDYLMTDRLLQMAADCLHQLNSRTVANLMTALCKLGTPPCIDLMEQVMPHALVMMPWFEPQHLTNVLWAIARVGIEPEDDWLESYLAATETRMQNFTPQGLANVIWALSRLGVLPDAQWMDTFVKKVAHRLQDFTPVDVSETLYAAACLDIGLDIYYPGIMKLLLVQLLRPPPASHPHNPFASENLRPPPAAAAYNGLTSSRSFSGGSVGTGNRSLELGPQSLANTMWALATMSVVPEKDWVVQVWDQVEGGLSAFDSHALSSFLWANAKLGLQPPASLMHSIYQYTLPRMSEYSPQALSNMIWAIAVLSKPNTAQGIGKPSTQEAAPSSSESSTSTHTASPVSTAAFVLSQPSREWLSCFLEAVLAQRSGFIEQGLATVLWSLVQLQVTPDPAWAAQVLSLLQALERSNKGNMLPQNLSTIIWSLAKMGYQLNEGASTLLENLLREQLQRDCASSDAANAQLQPVLAPDDFPCNEIYQGFQPQEISNILYSFAKFKHVPEPDVMQSLLNKLHDHMEAVIEAGAQSSAASLDAAATMFQAQSLANSVWALAVLEVHPGREWMKTFWAACVALLPTFNAKDLSQTVYALARLKWSPHDYEHPGEGHLQASATECDDPSHEKDTLLHSFSDQVALLPLVPSVLPGESSGEAVHKGSETTASGTPDDAWAAPLLAQGLVALPQCSPQDFSNLAWGLAQMGVRPGEQWLSQLATQLCRCAATCPGEYLAITTWALGKMDFQPMPNSLRSVEEALYRCMPSLKPREMAAVIWAFKAMRYSLHAEWLETYANQCMELAGKFSQQDWAVVVYSLAAMVEMNPTASFYLEDLLILPQLGTKIASFQAAELAMIFFACGMLGAKSDRLLGCLLASCQENMSDFSATQLSGIICSCAKLKHQPTTSFMLALFSEFEQRMPTLSSSVIACVLWAVSTLEAKSSTGSKREGVTDSGGETSSSDRHVSDAQSSWMRSVTHVLPQRMGDMSVQELAMTLWALGEARPYLPMPVLANFQQKISASNGQYDKATQKALSRAMRRLKAITKKAKVTEDAATAFAT